MTRRFVMPMLAAAILAAGSLLGSPAAAAGPPAPHQVSPAAEPPTEFGTDWHDPLTAAPPVSRPHTASCEVTLADTQFRDFTPYEGTYTPPKGCGDKWSKVVLRLEGSVKGRQFDRLGYLHIGGVEVLRTSTPEPSPDGISWSVEKDVTRYSRTLGQNQPVEMLIGNVVDDTYTGVINVKATLTFYGAEKGRPEAKPAAGSPADQVLTLKDGTLTTPRNSERILAEVYATGSGGGCEEFWYLTAPAEAPYSCKADKGPYREVQITVDGQLAGIAAPFPTVWTGGWSNPFLWYVVPGPRAFDVQPIVYDLTPYASLFNDGRAHRVEIGVVGVPQGQAGWSVPVNVLVWQDQKRDHVSGAVTRHHEGDLANSSKYTPGSEHRLDTRGGHSLTVSGYVDTSHGRVRTTVTRAVDNTSGHRWTEGEDNDALKAVWHDDETVAVDGRGPVRATHTRRTFTMDGAVTFDADNRLRTVMTMADRASVERTWGDRRVGWSVLDDTYTGDAAYTANVPRDQRHAVATTGEHYTVRGSDGCYDHRIVTVQGTLTRNEQGC